MSAGAFRYLLQWLGLVAPEYRPAVAAAQVVRAPPESPIAILPAAPPWSVTAAASSLDGGEIRATILRDLLGQLDEIGTPQSPESAADARFLSVLVRCLGSETLELPVFPEASLRLDRLLR
jgi:hypothetical protein